MRRLTISAHEARLLSMLAIRPDEKRDYRAAKRVMQLDDTIRLANQKFDDAIEEILKRRKPIVQRIEVKMTPEDIELIQEINTEIENLDKEGKDTILTILLEDALAETLESLTRDVRGVPTDRINGPAYIRMFEAVEKMEKVSKVKEVPEGE